MNRKSFLRSILSSLSAIPLFGWLNKAKATPDFTEGGFGMQHVRFGANDELADKFKLGDPDSFVILCSALGSTVNAVVRQCQEEGAIIDSIDIRWIDVHGKKPTFSVYCRRWPKGAKPWTS